MQVAIYLRVSSQRQAEKDLSIPAQRKELLEYASRQGWRVVAEFVDEARSGKRADQRQAFQAMISQSQQKDCPWEAVLVWRRDRFARNRGEAALYDTLLQKRNIRLLSATEPTVDGASGVLTEGMLDVIAEFQVAKLAEDVRRGMRETASRGYFNGGPPPLGYKVIHEGDAKGKKRSRLEPDPDAVPIIQRIFHLCAHQHLSGRAIARQMRQEGIRHPHHGRALSSQMVLSMLRNPVYAGYMVWNRRGGKGRMQNQDKWILTPDSHPPIVDPDLFDKAQHSLQQRRPDIRPPRQSGSSYLLTGLLTCTHCGSSYTGRTKERIVRQDDATQRYRYFYYICLGRIEQGSGFCEAPYIPCHELDTKVIQAVGNILSSPDGIQRILAHVHEIEDTRKSPRTHWEEELTTLNTQRERWYDAIEAGTVAMDEVKNRLDRLSHRIREVEENLMRLHRPVMVIDPDELKAFLERWPKALKAAIPISQRRALIRWIVQKIEVEDRIATLTMELHEKMLDSLHIRLD